MGDAGSIAAAPRIESLPPEFLQGMTWAYALSIKAKAKPEHPQATAH